MKMRRQLTDTQDSRQDYVPEPLLPADHVLYSGAIIFPGAFDLHGRPLFVFPVDGHARLPELSKAEVVDFIKYFHCLYKKQHHSDTLVSVVADLSDACLFTVKLIADILLLLENAKRTIHTVYMVRPQRKEVLKLLQEILLPKTRCTSFKIVLLNEERDLCDHIDQSQLPTWLGGFLIYCHQSWVPFIKEIDAFVQEFTSVVKRMPSCIASMRALCGLPLPTAVRDLHQFCSFNEAKFHQLRSEVEFSGPSDPGIPSKQSNTWRDQPKTQPCNWTVGSQVSLDDPQLGSICRVLSSTFTDGRDQSCCSTDRIPSLLWDSYDLHQESINSGINVTIKDFRMKEHKVLEMETDQASEILEVGDNVLAQEIMLEVWDNEKHFGLMSSTRLLEDAVVGLEDAEDRVDHAELLNLSSSQLSGSGVESKASICGCCPEATVVAEAGFHRPNLTTEPRVVRVKLDLMVQDKVKGHGTGYRNEKQGRAIEGFQIEAEKGVEINLDPECKQKITLAKSHWRETDSSQTVWDTLSAGLCRRPWGSHSAAVLEHAGRTEIAQTDSSMGRKTGMQNMDQSPDCHLASEGMIVCFYTENAGMDQERCFPRLQTRPDCAFDPGGQSLSANLGKHDSPHPCEVISSPPSPVAKSLLALQRNSLVSLSEDNPGHGLGENGRVWLECISSDMSRKDDTSVGPLQKKECCMATSAQMETWRNMERTWCMALTKDVLSQCGLSNCWVVTVITEHFRTSAILLKPAVIGLYSHEENEDFPVDLHHCSVGQGLLSGRDVVPLGVSCRNSVETRLPQLCTNQSGRMKSWELTFCRKCF
uniref:uncharacterized protein si:ch211-241j12.4 isoform X2 n=1 Tax=Doryrhamphus excisus TaxID=161450 RepID=UPI0025AE6E04|nr:uncharacterized protein si:ch211-241j12.4 isoform X2 [Doryrhamphus excisus]